MPESAANNKEHAATRDSSDRQAGNYVASDALGPRDHAARPEREVAVPRTGADHVELETLIREISMEFTRTSAGQIDQSIPMALKRIATFFGADLARILEVYTDSKLARIRNVWCAEEADSVSGDLNMAEALPWHYEAFERNEPVTLDSLGDIPAEGEVDRRFLSSCGVKSSLCVPLPIGPGPVYVLAIQTMREEHAWPKAILPELRLLGVILVDTLLRGHAETWLSLAADSTKAGLWTLDLGTMGFTLSEGARALFCFASDEEVTFDRLLEVVHPEDRELVRQIVRKSLDAQDMVWVEYRVVLPDGTLRWIASRGSCCLTASGQPDCLMGISIDITDRKLANIALRDGKALTDAVFDSVPGLLYLYTFDGRLVRWNRQHEEHTGYTGEELPNFRVNDWFEGEDLAKLGLAWNQVFTEGRTEVELDLIRKDGTKVPYFFTGVRLSIDGKPHMVGIGIDITQRRKAEEALAEQLCLERLISDLSTRLVGAECDQLASTVNKALGGIAELLHAEHTVLLRLKENPDYPVSTHCRMCDGLDATWPGPAWYTQLPVLSETMARGEMLVFQRSAELAPLVGLAEHELPLGMPKSCIMVPLAADALRECILIIETHREEINWSPVQVQCVRTVAEVVGTVVSRQCAERRLAGAMNEISDLNERLRSENVYLREEVKLVQSHSRIVGQGKAISAALSQVEQIVRTDTTILLLGETGTGKGLFASTIHDLSPRSDRVMVRADCAAMPETLIESELFGREKGAYTGALTKQLGRFELAHGSTIFLDEIGELSPAVQVKLLRVLEEKQIERLGNPRTIPVDVRIIAATNRDLQKAVSEGRFRADLYYRINVFSITVPPLRERPEDIPLLAWAFLDEFSEAQGKQITGIAQDSMERMQRYSWPGNVREMRNVIERAAILTTGHTLRIEASAFDTAGITRSMSMVDVERQHILKILEMVRWRIRGKSGAAEILGLRPTTLEGRMKKLGITRPDR